MYADGMAICSAKTVEESFALLVAVYYVFNLVMCKHLMKTLVFMLKYACKIDDPVRDSYILRAYKQCLILVEKLTLKHQSKNRAGGGVVGGKRSCEIEAVSVTKGKGQMCPHGKESENAVSVTKGKGQMCPRGKESENEAVEKLTLKHHSKNRAGGGVVGGKRSCESEAVGVTKGKGQMCPRGKDSENDNKENEGENNNKEIYERSEGKVCRPTAAKRARGKAERSNKSGNGDYYFY